MENPDQVSDSKKNNERPPAGKERLRTGLLLLGSAVFGGIAVAFWNRRTLAKMQEKQENNPEINKIVDENAIY